MSLGGGSFTVENKVLPGAYINFVSSVRGSFMPGERGTGAMGFAMDWGDDGIVEVDRENIRSDCFKLFGYEYDHEKMVYIREFFRHGKKLYVGRINNGGLKASCKYADAKYTGSRGNYIFVEIATNVDNESRYDFITYLGSEIRDIQTVSDMKYLKDNDFVVWKRNVTEITVGSYRMSGGTTAEVSGRDITNFCTALEALSFNTLTVISDDEELQEVMIEFTKRMRDEVGSKFQYVVYDNTANYEGVISVYNVTSTIGMDCGICAWVCGAAAGCGINEGLTNMKYDGELGMVINESQAQLERLISLGYFVFHGEGDDIRVLKDINTLTDFTDTKGQVFANNQTVRVCDQIATDTAALFKTSYLGRVPNDKAGRNSLWCDLVKYHEKLMNIRAIELFDEEDIEVSAGEDKTSVVINESIVPVNSMDKLYMKVYVE